MESGRSSGDWLSMPISRQQAEGSGLAFILAIAAVGLAFIGIGIASNACSLKNSKCSDVQTRNVTLNITPCNPPSPPTCNSQVSTTDIFFPKPFTSIPRVRTQITGPETGIDERSWTILATSSQTWTAQPAGVTELFGNSIHEWVMLWGTDDNMSCTLVVNVISAGAATAILRVQSSPDDVTWSNLQPIPNGDVPINNIGVAINNYASAGNGGLGDNGPSGNQPGPYFRVVGLGGNGIISPSFGNIYFECWWPTTFLSTFVQNVTPTDFILGVEILLPSNINPQQVFVTWTACTVGC